MKALFWIGLVVLILGIASLIIPIPDSERGGVNIGGVPIGVETKTEEKAPPLVSAAMILVGAGLMIAGKRKS